MTLTELQAAMGEALGSEDLFGQARKYACEYMNTVGNRTVYPTAEAVNALTGFAERLPAGPTNPADLLQQLNDLGGPATVAQSGGRYFGFVNGGILPPALAVKWLADTWDQNAALHVISPVAAQLEQLCEDWLVELFGLPAGTAAGFVSGTSTATLCGLAAGRDALFAGLDWDIHGQGLFGAPELTIVVGAEAHATVFKALSLLGLGRERVIRVAVDEQGCMLPEALPPLDNRTLLILQAGNVNSGGFDPFVSLCTVARAAGAWVHVDGAFGLWAAGARQTRHLTAGIELADSWSVDAHKTLNAPYDSGVILCRHRTALVSAMQASGSYISYGEKRDGMLYTPEMSRRARGIELWATLKALGRAGIEALVGGLCDHARQIARELDAKGFRILNRIDFNQIVVACGQPGWTSATLARLQASGVCWCGGSVWRGETVIRVSICSWATTSADIMMTVEAFCEAREKAMADCVNQQHPLITES